MFSRIKAWARRIKQDGHAIYLASRDGRVPWYAKVLAIAIAAYALSPVDLIPDFIPVLGYLDDLIILPLGILLVVSLIPAEVMNDDPVFAARAIEIGAKGYVSKTGDPNDLVEAIREVGKGGVYLPPAIARSIAFAGPAFARSPLSRLTSREMEILRLLSAGKSLSEIAWLVHSSYKTVANTSSIMRHKLGVRTSAELVRLAIESGVA